MICFYNNVLYCSYTGKFGVIGPNIGGKKMKRNIYMKIVTITYIVHLLLLFVLVGGMIYFNGKNKIIYDDLSFFYFVDRMFYEIIVFIYFVVTYIIMAKKGQTNFYTRILAISFLVLNYIVIPILFSNYAILD